MKYTPMVCSPSGKSMVLRKILFRSGNSPGKRWKKYNKKIMSIKFSFMHYMKWTNVMLLVVFEEFELVCFFAAAPSSSPPVPTDLSGAALSVVLRERCSENFQQVYKRTPTPKCDFNGCSPVILLHISRTPFPKNKYGELIPTIFSHWFVSS